MTTTRETLLIDLAAQFTSELAPVEVQRNTPLPTAIDGDGLLILRDGEPGPHETTLSPLTYHFQHEAELELYFSGDNADAAFDTTLEALEAIFEQDRTRGGQCDWSALMPPKTDTLNLPGLAGVKAGTVMIQLHYATASSSG